MDSVLLGIVWEVSWRRTKLASIYRGWYSHCCLNTVLSIIFQLWISFILWLLTTARFSWLSLVNLVNCVITLHLLNRHARLSCELINFLNLVSTHNGASEDTVISTIRYWFTICCHHDLGFVSLMWILLISGWVLLNIWTSCVGRYPNVIVIKHSLAFGVSASRLVVKCVLCLHATSLEVTIVDLSTSDISRILSTVSMPNNLRIFITDLVARIHNFNLLSWDANWSTFLVRHILHPFLETHSSFWHILLLNDSIIGLVDHLLLLISSRLWLLRIVIPLHTAIECGSCLNIWLVYWINSIVSAQVCSLIVMGVGLSRSTHAHIHLLFDTIRDAVVTLIKIIWINTTVSNLWTQPIAVSSSSWFGLKLVFVDDSIVSVSGILHLSIYQHIIILLIFDHVSLERVVANVSKLANLTLWRKPIHLTAGLELTARALLA